MIGRIEVERAILGKAVQVNQLGKRIVIAHIALLLCGCNLIADRFPSRKLVCVFAFIEEPFAVKSAAARGVKLALDHDDVIVGYAPDALDVILVHILLHVKDAVILTVDVHDGKCGIGIFQGIRDVCGKVVDRVITQQRGVQGVTGIVQQRIVAAVAQNQAVVSVQHLACVRTRLDGAPVKERIAEAALALVQFGAKVPRFACDDLEGLLRESARRSTEDAHAAVLRDDQLACGIRNLDMRGHFQFFRIMTAQLVKIIGRERQRHGIQCRAIAICLDVAMRDDSAHKIAVRIKASRTNHGRVLAGHADRVLKFVRSLGRNAAIGGIAHGIVRALGSVKRQLLLISIHAAHDGKHGRRTRGRKNAAFSNGFALGLRFGFRFCRLLLRGLLRGLLRKLVCLITACKSRQQQGQ